MSELISPGDLWKREESGRAPIIVDVRSPEEYAAGHLPGAENIPSDQLDRRIAEIPKDKPVVVY